jgi:hypothetical protein
MKEYATANNSQETWVESGISFAHQYYSVEISLRGVEHMHQFKIWNIPQDSMCVVVKPDSGLLGSLKVGDNMKMKFYRTNALSQPMHLWTEISHITKEDQGRFKGHYLVGLAILDGQGKKHIH